MNVIAQLQADREKYKTLKSREEKAAFIWDYYKVPIIALMSFLVILLLVIVNNLGRKQTAMYLVMVNSDAAYVECDEEQIQQILADSDYDAGDKQIEISSSYTLGTSGSSSSDAETLQVLTALFSISDMDVYIADQEYFDYFAGNGGYADLSLLMDQDLLDQWEDCLYYTENEDGTTTLSGIILPEDSVFHQAGYYHDTAILGIVARADNLEAAVAFLKSFLRDRN